MRTELWIANTTVSIAAHTMKMLVSDVRVVSPEILGLLVGHKYTKVALNTVKTIPGERYATTRGVPVMLTSLVDSLDILELVQRHASQPSLVKEVAPSTYLIWTVQELKVDSVIVDTPLPTLALIQRMLELPAILDVSYSVAKKNQFSLVMLLVI